MIQTSLIIMFLSVSVPILIALLIYLILKLYKQNKKLITTIESLTENYKVLLAQKKSSEVVLGQITEQLVPFLDNCSYNPHKMKFIGQPIDYICFDDDKVTFIEVKSGKSKLSKKQTNIKSLVLNKQVFWDEIRIPKKLNQNKNDSETTT